MIENKLATVLVTGLVRYESALLFSTLSVNREENQIILISSFNMLTHNSQHHPRKRIKRTQSFYAYIYDINTFYVYIALFVNFMHCFYDDDESIKNVSDEMMIQQV